MKYTYKYIVFALALLAPVAVNAQSSGEEEDPAGYDGFKIENGVATRKSVSTENSDGSYTIKLETFAYGKSYVSTEVQPVDIVLVLDISGSMKDNGYNLKVEKPGGWTYNDVQNKAYPNDFTTNDQFTSGGYISRWYYDSAGSTEVYPKRSNNKYILGTQSGTSPYGNGTYGATANDPIYTDPLYPKVTRLYALKKSLEAFIDVVNANDMKSDGTRVGHQISIVTFSNDADIVLDWSSLANAESIKNTNVKGLAASGSTMSDLGMQKAQTLLEQKKNDGHAKVVVMFTDGVPGTAGTSWASNSTSVANSCIQEALKCKTDYGALVYSVGLITNVSGTSLTNVNNYMNFVSSNYPSASNMDTSTSSGTFNGDYFQDAATNDITAVFTAIASTIGGSEKQIPATTEVRDVVSSSFELPEGFDANSVVAYSVDIKPDGLDWYDVPDHTVPTPPTSTAHVTPLTIVTDAEVAENDDSKVAVITGDGRLTVKGFNYSKPDGNTLGSGNWVGERIPSSGSAFYAGKELVVEFNIVPKENITGGTGTKTNAKGSGVYVLNENGQYESINDYEEPKTTLSVTLVITKTGLKHGESATFQILRFRPKGFNPANPEDTSGYEYTVIGKPVPDIPTLAEGEDWPDDNLFSKVILTNKGADGVKVVKTLRALDPYWIYQIFEDDWAWSYEYSGSTTLTTSDVVANPFDFTDNKKEDAIKHAEAVTINHFIPLSQGTQVETYKSNEVFTPPSN